MIDPDGPLPPAVYLRRRLVAGTVTVAAILLLAWIIGRLVGGADEAPPHGVSARTSQPPPSRPVSPSSATSASSSAAASPAVAPAPPPAPPLPPQPCPDAAIQVLAETGEPAYRVGQRPLLRLIIVNAGQLACVRDVSRSARELVITGPDGARLWSSNDCYSPPGEDSRVLQPGERLTFTVTWAGRTSAPGCPRRRGPVPAGSYLVTGRLGPIAGPPVPLQLTP